MLRLTALNRSFSHDLRRIFRKGRKTNVPIRLQPSFLQTTFPKYRVWYEKTIYLLRNYKLEMFMGYAITAGLCWGVALTVLKYGGDELFINLMDQFHMRKWIEAYINQIYEQQNKQTGQQTKQKQRFVLEDLTGEKSSFWAKFTIGYCYYSLFEIPRDIAWIVCSIYIIRMRRKMPIARKK